ncbi:hypothetical protein HBB16_21855 [Pseudonocardia sp. MCCB 268]|nr:hypothetical protein [Pseudonocardia cytotoxica]
MNPSHRRPGGPRRGPGPHAARHHWLRPRPRLPAPRLGPGADRLAQCRRPREYGIASVTWRPPAIPPGPPAGRARRLRACCAARVSLIATRPDAAGSGRRWPGRTWRSTPAAPWSSFDGDPRPGRSCLIGLA